MVEKAAAKGARAAKAAKGPTESARAHIGNGANFLQLFRFIGDLTLGCRWLLQNSTSIADVGAS